jgi:Alpha/beta hydrolase domain containing 18
MSTARGCTILNPMDTRATAHAPFGFDGSMADLLFRPWFDRVALHAVTQWYFPLSRAWAAALEAASDADAFTAAVGPFRLPQAQVARIAAFAVARQAAYEEAAEAWRDSFFASVAASPGRLREMEERRLARAHQAMAARSAFMPLHLARRLPPIRWRVAGPEAVATRHGARLATAEHRFPQPSPATVEASHEMAGTESRIGWLRFPSTVGGRPDTAWARVGTPLGVKHPPTLVFLHGIAMETEFGRGDGRSMLKGLTGAGIRVIQPEAPWHGRRRMDGFFGGEPVMAQGPLGMIELFQAWIAELAALIAWARETSHGPVAIAGVSLGALTSQLLASAAGSWQASMRPDVLFLVATSGGVIEAGAAGGLAQALGAGARLIEAGWTPEELARWRPLLEPIGVPAVDPQRIIMVLGTADEVTPFDGGAALARQWNLPDANVFVRPQGHFSVAMGLAHRADPLHRLVELLR